MSAAEHMIDSIQIGNLEQADLYFQEALMEDSYEELLGLAEALYAMGFTSHLEALLEKLLQLNPQDDYLNILMAEIYFNDGNLEEAFFWLDQVQTDSSYYSHSLLLQADMYLSQGLNEVAEMKLQQASDLTDQDPVVQFALAELYFTLQRFAEALPFYQRLVGQDVDFANKGEISFRLAESLAAMGEWEEAIDYYLTTIEEEENVDKYFQLGLCYFQLENYDPAIKSFEKVLDFDPSYSTAYIYLAKSLQAHHQTDQAYHVLLKALEVDDQSAEIYHLLALFSQGEAEDSEREHYFDQALRLNPWHLQTRIDYMRFLAQRAEWEKLIELSQRATDADFEDPSILWLQARAYDELEEYDQALDSFEKAKGQWQDSIEFLEDYCQFMRAEGRWDLLASALDQALTLDPHSPYFKLLEVERLEREANHF